MSSGNRTLSARRRLSVDRSTSRFTLATCAARVHARIGPAGACHARPPLDIVPDERRDGVFDHLLNREPVRLALPADVVRAVVGERQLERFAASVRDAPRRAGSSVLSRPGFTAGRRPAWHSGHDAGS